MVDELPRPDGPAVHADHRVLIVNDHHGALAELLSGALEAAGMQVLGRAHSVAQAVAMGESMQPDVIVVDLKMLAQEEALAVTRRLREIVPNAGVAVLAAHSRPDWVARLAEAGASAFIPTSSSLDQLIDVLSRLQWADHGPRSGPMLITPSTRSGPSSPASSAPGDGTAPRLTRRELELLRCLGEGMTVKAIAEILGITLNTCRSYLKSLRGKLDAGTTLETVLSAQRLGLLP